MKMQSPAESQVEDRDKRNLTLAQLHREVKLQQYRDHAQAQATAARALRLAEKSGSHREISRAMLDCGIMHYRLGHSAMALEKIGQARGLARRCLADDLVLEADIVRAHTLLFLTRFDEAYELLEHCRLQTAAKAAEPYDVAHLPFELDILIGITIVKLFNGQYHDAVNAAYQCIYLTHQHPISQDESVKVLAAVANVYTNLEDFDKAHTYFEKCLKFAESCGNSHYAAHSLLRMAQINLSTLGDYKKASEFVQRAVQFLDRLDSAELQILVLSNSIYIHQAAGNIDLAIETCQMAVGFAEGCEQPDALIQGTGFLGMLHIYNGDLETGIGLLENALAKALRYELPRVQTKIHEALAQVYEQLGQAAKALEHFKQHSALSNQLWGPEQQRKIAKTQFNELISNLELELERQREKYSEARSEAERHSRELARLALYLIRKEDEHRILRSELRSINEQHPELLSPEARSLAVSFTVDRKEDFLWETFERQFEQVHGNFSAALLRRCDKISPAELKVCTLLRTGLSSKEIAGLLSMTSASVDVYRHRIRKKLQLSAGINLASYLGTL